MSKFQERLQDLGFASYLDYLASPHWAEFKGRYRAMKRLCAVCDCAKIQLHHHSYARLGHEEFEDITPLCREHHLAVHEWLKANKGGNVAATRKAVRHLRGDPPKPLSPKQTKRARQAAELSPRLYDLQKQTGIVPLKKCDNVVRDGDIKSIRRLINKMLGLEKPKRQKQPKIKRKKSLPNVSHKDWLAHQAAVKAALEDPKTRQHPEKRNDAVPAPMIKPKNRKREERQDRKRHAEECEQAIRDEARAGGIELAASMVTHNKTHHFPHWRFRFQGRNILHYWPTSQTGRQGEIGKTSHVGTPDDALALALRLIGSAAEAERHLRSISSE